MTLTRRALALAVLIAGAAGCGQQGPLVLPEEARPVERVESPTQQPNDANDEEQDER